MLTAGARVGAAISEWDVRLFSPWRYDTDEAVRRLLEPTGWTAPPPDVPPTGAEPVRDERPLLVRTVNADGTVQDIAARAVIDASGTWGKTNPLGHSGLPAVGQEQAAPYIAGPLPDVLGRDRARFAGRHTLVVGMGHSAANTLLALAELAGAEPGTRITWVVRGASVARLYGGGEADGLPARGVIGTRLKRAVQSGAIEPARHREARPITLGVPVGVGAPGTGPRPGFASGGEHGHSGDAERAEA